MAKFSERYGYISPSLILIRENMTDDIINAICTAYDLLENSMHFQRRDSYEEMEAHLWRYFLNKRLNDFYISDRSRHIVATQYIKSDDPWYKKMDLIEETLCYTKEESEDIHESFIEHLNGEFKRLNFAYRVIDNKIVEVTSEEEIITIETALRNSSNGVKEHLQTALSLLSKHPNGDYRNSIKESISAVEAIVREITGENTLNLKKLEDAGVMLPSVLQKSFELLYGYTNNKSTGIRHALMDDANIPSADEATFMLVSCSAFINYLTKKKT